jgi:hypothetical protein
MVDMYEEYGLFKCLGCEHYLSGDHFDCRHICPRTEQIGIVQMQAKIQFINEDIEELELQKAELLKLRNKISEMINKAQDNV